MLTFIKYPLCVLSMGDLSMDKTLAINKGPSQKDDLFQPYGNVPYLLFHSVEFYINGIWHYWLLQMLPMGGFMHQADIEPGFLYKKRNICVFVFEQNNKYTSLSPMWSTLLCKMLTADNLHNVMLEMWTFQLNMLTEFLMKYKQLHSKVKEETFYCAVVTIVVTC